MPRLFVAFFYLLALVYGKKSTKNNGKFLGIPVYDRETATSLNEMLRYGENHHLKIGRPYKPALMRLSKQNVDQLHLPRRGDKSLPLDIS
jgi:hypothetical protein